MANRYSLRRSTHGTSLVASKQFLLTFLLYACITDAETLPRLDNNALSAWSTGSSSGCKGPNCFARKLITLGFRGSLCGRNPPPPPLSEPPAQPSRPPRPSPAPPVPDGQPAESQQPVLSTAICGQWYTTERNVGCQAIVDRFGLLNTTFLRSLNPTLNCAAVQIGLIICVNPFATTAPANCAAWHVVWDGQTCQTVADKYSAWLPWGIDDLYWCNAGLDCMTQGRLTRGMSMCVKCPF